MNDEQAGGEQGGEKSLAAAWRQHEYRAPGKFPPPPRLTSLKRMMLGCRSERWFMISLATFSSICEAQKKTNPLRPGIPRWGARTQRGRNPGARTLSPLGMYFMATSSLVSLFRMSRATPKLPEPMSLSSSYLSIGSLARAGGWGWLWRGRRWGKGEGRIRSLTRRLLLGVRLL